jgi:hypothetical protein
MKPELSGLPHCYQSYLVLARGPRGFMIDRLFDDVDEATMRARELDQRKIDIAVIGFIAGEPHILAADRDVILGKTEDDLMQAAFRFSSRPPVDSN